MNNKPINRKPYQGKHWAHDIKGKPVTKKPPGNKNGCLSVFAWIIGAASIITAAGNSLIT